MRHAAFMAANTGGGLLERASELAVLGDALGAVAAGCAGRVTLVRGEAGVGKTALLHRFRDECPGAAQVVWGACDSLLTPRPLGALFAVAEALGGELEAGVVGGFRAGRSNASHGSSEVTESVDVREGRSKNRPNPEAPASSSSYVRRPWIGADCET
jgi:predicted ATPase